MKKPIILIKTKKDIFKFCLCLALCFSASLLFFAPEKSITVFAGEQNLGVKGLYSLVRSLCF